MPCNAIALRSATVELDALLKTEPGVKALFAWIEKEMGVPVKNSVDNFLSAANEWGSGFAHTDLGYFRFCLDGATIQFPSSVEDDEERMDRMTKEISALSGKIQQMKMIAVLSAALGNSAKMTQGPNGMFVLRGEVEV